MIIDWRREQTGQGVNTTGTVEIPRIVLEELLANALIHRDYFVSAPIRVFLFDDRVEIISGLKAGDKVVIKGNYLLLQQSKPEQ